MMISSKYEQGSVWLAKVRFDDTNEVKIRPVVIVSNEKGIDNKSVIICPISSSEARNEFDVGIIEWKQSGLRKRSVVRTTKIKPILKQLLLKKIGVLPIEVLEDTVNQIVKAVFVFKNPNKESIVKLIDNLDEDNFFILNEIAKIMTILK